MVHVQSRGKYELNVRVRQNPHIISTHRWEDNIKIDLQEVGWWGMDWTDLAQDRERWQKLVNVVMNIWVP
jgi:hypothetical protein